MRIAYTTTLRGRGIQVKGNLEVDGYIEVSPLDNFGCSASLQMPKVDWDYSSGTITATVKDGTISHSTGWSGVDDSVEQTEMSIAILRYAIDLLHAYTLNLQPALKEALEEQQARMDEINAKSAKS